MHDPTPYTLIPLVTEPAPDARFREELARERRASVEAEPGYQAEPIAPELLLARQLHRAAQFVRFS